jgi:hypothetical protein
MQETLMSLGQLKARCRGDPNLDQPWLSLCSAARVLFAEHARRGLGIVSGQPSAETSTFAEAQVAFEEAKTALARIASIDLSGVTATDVHTICSER